LSLKRNLDTSDQNWGVPQGGIISPLLSNLILHELDKLIDELPKRAEENNGGLYPQKTTRPTQNSHVTVVIKKLVSPTYPLLLPRTFGGSGRGVGGSVP